LSNGLSPQGEAHDEWSNNTLIEHRVRDFDEASNVSANHQVAGLIILRGSVPRIFVDRRHNLAEAKIDFLARPRQTHGILSHLKARNGDPARIRGLARTVKNFFGKNQ